MKNIYHILSAAVMAMAALSCTKDIDIYVETPAPATVPLTVSVGSISTRAIVSGDEDKNIYNVQVVVFNEDGKLEKSTNLVTNTTKLTLDVLPGKKTVWAVANLLSKISESSIPTAADLSSRIIEFDSNTINKLTMSASTEKTVSLDDATLELKLKHLACKVVIDGIKRDFSNTAYAGIPLTIKKIYLSNVVGKCSIGCEGEQSNIWYNKLGVIPIDLAPAVKAMTVDDGLSIDLPEGGSYTTTHSFYAFPNNCTDPTYGGSWTPRRTRLVLECDYGGRTCYYPVSLPQDASKPLVRNKVYHISLLTLKKPGSTSADDPHTEVSSTISFTVDIKVSEWEDDASYTEEYK